MEQNNEIIALAKEVLDDAELNRVSAEALVFKATRLARLVKHQNMLEWLNLERFGYSDKDPDLGWMLFTGRTFNEDTRVGYWGSIAVQEAAIEASLVEMEVVKNFKPNGEYSYMQFSGQQQQIKTLATSIAFYKKIRSRVISIIQEFATDIYYEKIFSQKAGDIFKQFSEKIDNLLADSVGDVLLILPSIFERLNSNDVEATNQALLSCRRILDAFINKLYPASGVPAIVDGEELVADASKTKNRFKAYISQRSKSKSLTEKLFKYIVILYDRSSTAIHNDVTHDEARSLVLQLYVTLGEILILGDIPDPVLPKENPSAEELVA